MAYPVRPLLFFGPLLRPPGDEYGVGDLERLGGVRPVAQQIQMPPVRRDHLRQLRQVDLFGVGRCAVDPVGAEHPAPVARADPGVRLQIHPGGLGTSGACGRAQLAAFPCGRHHGPEAEPPGCTRPVR
ncbi:hypothetical protein [Streptomyces caeruleatus]|uniref:hypothetical protein n=1 Tax=Streptomyces caeruleatus TaxID=661399 RepID=UPI001FC9A369|nr:hypothetical protein [Streptomyces caeruleatus]